MKLDKDSKFWMLYQPLPISHNQSRVTPANIPPKRNKTRRFPNAFCSGPCRIYKPKINFQIHDFEI